MKLKVVKSFADKYNLAKIYEAGESVCFDDEARCKDLIARGLCETVEELGKKSKKPSAQIEEPASEVAEALEAATEPENAEQAKEPGAKQKKAEPAPSKKKNTKK